MGLRKFTFSWLLPMMDWEPKSNQFSKREFSDWLMLSHF